MPDVLYLYCIPRLTMATAPTGNSCVGVPATEADQTGRYGLAWKNLSRVLDAFGKQ